MTAGEQKKAAVMKAYGFPPDLTEPEIVSRLFEMCAKLAVWRHYDWGYFDIGIGAILTSALGLF